ncbi:hypothetical protein [Porticoccus litoralis]|uniref:Sel1 repeat family protein n=1 Tax=Porticoccus litoralis TaxID=434086 RepID=A0AAW8B190_9GAMM|nr:hypothetical protein [Porticoccus litoralis]MDP1519712.1 hypothetical protein [Porticoccus litoralis]TNE84708.1 MAG: sel1 repeat family protein [Gammaproteobacteria bacterium]
MIFKTLRYSVLLGLLISGQTFASTVFEDTLQEAKNGNPQAQSKLGNMYAEGRGTEQNNVKAFIWMSAAKANGDTASEHSLNTLRKRMSLKEVIDGQAKAAKCIGSHYQRCK